MTLLIWGTVSAILLGFWFYTIYTVLMQQRAWKFFAAKKGLRYHSNGVLSTPTLSGAIDGFKVDIFMSEHSAPDQRSEKRLTAIEVTLPDTLSSSLVLASGGMTHLAEAMTLKSEGRLAHESWDDSFLFRADEYELAAAYLNADRLGLLLPWMTSKTMWFVFMAVDGNGVLRIDTPLPITHPKELNTMVQRLVDAAKALRLSKSDENALRQYIKDTAAKNVGLKLEGQVLSEDVGLALEDDDAP